MRAISCNNTKKVISILRNSTKKRKILELNEEDNFGKYPLYLAIDKNNIEIVQLLIEYANQHHIIE